MTKLKTLLALAMMLVALPTLAAEPDDAVDGRHFGVRVQYEMNTSTKYSHMFHMGPGFAFGANYYAPFANRFYFNTELMLGYDTFGYRGDLENSTTSAISTASSRTSTCAFPWNSASSSSRTAIFC